MQAKARLFAIDNFGKQNEYNKAVFLDLETMDKVGVMVNEDQKKVLSDLVGRDGLLTFSLVAKGFDYSVKLVGFKAAA